MTMACEVIIAAATAAAAAPPAPALQDRAAPAKPTGNRISWWYYGHNQSDIAPSLAFVRAHRRLFSSVMVGCGLDLGHDGSVTQEPNSYLL